MTKLTDSVKKWRGMTVSSVFHVPGFALAVIIGLALLVTMLLTGHITGVNPPAKETPSESAGAGR